MKSVLLWSLAAVVLVSASLAWLRDPPWLITMTTGFHAWETDVDGTRYRWTGGHASFFVPSGAAAIEIPMRVIIDTADHWPVAVTVTIDDRPADRVVLDAPVWRLVTVRLPPHGRRHVRRIDIRVDRMRDESHGVQIGEIVVR